MFDTFLYQVNVTRDCNLRCTHCYIHSDVKAASKIMSVPKFLSVIEQIRDHMLTIPNYKRAEIHVTGGEATMLGLPFFRHVVPAARDILSSLPQQVDFSIISNLLGHDAMDICKLFDGVNTSYEVDGRFPKQKLEDRWVERANALMRDGVRMNLTTSITKPVVDFGAANIVDRLIGYGFNQMHFGFFIPSGDGEVNYDTIMPRFEETSDFLIELAEFYWPRRHDLFINPIESLIGSVLSGASSDDIACPIISGSLDVNWDGNALTCIEEGGSLNPEWLGNISSSSLVEITKSVKYLRQRARAFRPVADVCSKCSDYSICRSGCSVLHHRWDGAGECPGFRKFISYIREKVDGGVGPRSFDSSERMTVSC